MDRLHDLCAHDMIAAISNFSKSSGHSSLVALAIMSHGDELGNICGNDKMATCSVQQVVDALCDHLQHAIKVSNILYEIIHYFNLCGLSIAVCN